MAEFTLSQVVEATEGTSTHTDNIKFLDVSTDTRTIESGFLFVALKGDTFDGHDFINTAIEKLEFRIRINPSFRTCKNLIMAQ